MHRYVIMSTGVRERERERTERIVCDPFDRMKVRNVRESVTCIGMNHVH